MNYLTEYYKNKCTELQKKLALLESWYAEAMRSGDPTLIRTEIINQQIKAAQAADQARMLHNTASAIAQSARTQQEWDKIIGQGGVESMPQHAKAREHEANVAELLDILAPIADRYDNPEAHQASMERRAAIDADTMRAVRQAISRMASGNQQVQQNVSQPQH